MSPLKSYPAIEVREGWAVQITRYLIDDFAEETKAHLGGRCVSCSGTIKVDDFIANTILGTVYYCHSCMFSKLMSNTIKFNKQELDWNCTFDTTDDI